MKILKQLLFTVFLGLFFYGQAQDSYSFRKYHDNPYWGLTVKAIPMYGEFSGGEPSLTTVSMGYGVDAQLDIFDRYKANFYYLSAKYGDKNSSSSIYDEMTKNDHFRFSYFELGGQYSFINKVKKENTFITVWSVTGKVSRNKSVTTSSGFITKAFVRRSKHIRGGFLRYKTILSLSEHAGSEKEPWATSTDGIMFCSSSFEYPQTHINNPFAARHPTYDMYAGMYVTGGYIGIGSTKNIDIRTKVDGYGKQGKSFENSFYFDLLFGSTKIDDFEGINGVNYNMSGDGASGFETKALGWRLGWEYIYKTKIGMGFSARTEIGSRPGLADSKWYFLMELGLTYTIGIEPLSGKLPE